MTEEILIEEKSAEEINASIESSFYKIYLLLNWKRKAWKSGESSDGTLFAAILE